MSVAHLSLQGRPVPAIHSIADRVRFLQAEARAIASDHIAAFEQALEEAVALAKEIQSGGDAYPVGAREIARRLGPDLAYARLNLQALRVR
jgi:hypothetical protein